MNVSMSYENVLRKDILPHHTHSTSHQLVLVPSEGGGEFSHSKITLLINFLNVHVDYTEIW